MTPPDKVFRAIRQIKENNPQEWNEIVEWLKWEWHDAAHASCRPQDNVECRWLQGHEQLLERLLAVIEQAAKNTPKPNRDKVMLGDVL